MSVYSMTGYASASSSPGASPDTAEDAEGSRPAQGNRATASISAEMRSVNNRFLDIALRLPDELRALEPALRDLIAASFRRGKIELRLNLQREADGAWPRPQPDQLSRLSRLEGTVQSWLPKAQPLTVHEVLQWCKGGANSERLDEPALEVTRRCVEGLREAREREGARLADVLLERLARLRELADQAEPIVPAVVQRQQARFLERWHEALATAGASASLPADALRERAMNEAAAYAIRIDVAEELARLRSHLDEIARLLKAGGELGKRLDFLIQELQREANTLGSKSAALELTSIAVEMKVAVEQMREQVQNLE